MKPARVDEIGIERLSERDVAYLLPVSMHLVPEWDVSCLPSQRAGCDEVQQADTCNYLLSCEGHGGLVG